MKATQFQDSGGNEIQVSLSGGGDIRVYVKSPYDPKESSGHCMLLTNAQANILINAIKDLAEGIE